MKYKHFTSNDFALDKKFQQWVLSPDDENDKFWRAYIGQHTDQQEDIAKAIDMVKLSGLSLDENANRKYLSIWEALKINAYNSQKIKTKNIVLKYVSVAAIFIGLLCITTFLLWKTATIGTSIEYVTNYSEVKEVVLPDGSIVTLNSNSKVKYSTIDWISLMNRIVFLEGEAFFKIVKTKDHKKFIVKTPHQVDVQVMGTEFNVNTKRQQTLIYLQSGKVKINSSSEEMDLIPGELAEYDQKEKKVKVKKVDYENNLAWMKNFFVFDDTPLIDISREIEDFYGTKVNIATDTLPYLRVTAKVPRDNLDLLLNVLSETLRVNVVKQNNTIYMKPRTGRQ